MQATSSVTSHLHIPTNFKSHSLGVDKDPILNRFEDKSIVESRHCYGLSVEHDLGPPAVSGDHELLLLDLNVESDRAGGGSVTLHGPEQIGLVREMTCRTDLVEMVKMLSLFSLTRTCPQLAGRERRVPSNIL